ncbi:atlastin GTPase isoform X2 [Calliopsis andreniformis]|uniref:atlastin GTPase isoform X2 n=1 Tax=Calliopsis andreniformis TaxID=337506 RepID=UPI003FCC58DF
MVEQCRISYHKRLVLTHKVTQVAAVSPRFHRYFLIVGCCQLANSAANHGPSAGYHHARVFLVGSRALVLDRVCTECLCLAVLPRSLVSTAAVPVSFRHVQESTRRDECERGKMNERRKTPSGRKRLEEPLTRPREPTRPPRMRTQQNRDNNTVHRNVIHAEKVAMTTLDENVNRVPRVYTTNEPVDHISWQERIEKVSLASPDNEADEGKPIPIVLAHPDHTFELNEEALEKILLQNDVKDRSVVVVSVAGAFRKGKSFLLDFFLRYMNSQYNNNNKVESWLGKEDEPLRGFSWKGGSERDTTGILMWSKVFPGTLPTGEKVAIILMDTQGAFDSQSTVRDCATVFALSTMLSSLQIYNLSQNIQEDDLQHLQLFTEYGRLALEKSGSTPFQKLQFLVRDWSYPYEAEYGAKGGQKILQRRLEISDRQHPELQSLRKHIQSCFSDISCFLMPHPGLNIATNPYFDGRLSEIQVEFKEQLKVLIPMLLAPENLVTKKINGQIVKARDLVEYFKSYIKIYKGDELPEPKSMLVATAEANNLSAVAEAKDIYMRSMENICGGGQPFLATASLEKEHTASVDKALQFFQNKRKMGGQEFSEMYREKLIKDMDEAFIQFKAQNENKNVFKAMRTAAVYGVVAVIMYILSGLFGLTGLYILANTCNFILGLCILALILWAYISYSGDFRSFGEVLDDMANMLWYNFMKPFYQQFVEKSVHVAVVQAAEMAANSTLNATVTANGKPKLS